MTDYNTEQYSEEPAITEEPQVVMALDSNEAKDDTVNQLPNDNIQQELQNKTTGTIAPASNQTGQEIQNYQIPKDSPPNPIVSTIEIQNNEEVEGNDIEKLDSVEKRADLYDADGDGVADDEMFEGSTHSFAVYFERKRNVDGVIIAYFVFFMQMVLYLVCAAQVMGDLSGSEFVIPVMVRYGQKCTDSTNLGVNIFIGDNYLQRLHQTPSNI